MYPDEFRNGQERNDSLNADASNATSSGPVTNYPPPQDGTVVDEAKTDFSTGNASSDNEKSQFNWSEPAKSDTGNQTTTSASTTIPSDNAVQQPASAVIEVKNSQSSKSKVAIFVAIGVIVLIAIAAFLAIYINVIKPSAAYSEANAAFARGDYAVAAEHYAEAGTYEDARSKLQETILALIAQGDFDDALVAAENIPGQEKDVYVSYATGAKNIAEGNAADGLKMLLDAISLEPAKTQYVEESMNIARSAALDGEYGLARSIISSVTSVDGDNIEIMNDCKFISGYMYLMEGKNKKAQNVLKTLPDNYKVGSYSVKEMLGTLAVIGTWKLVKWYDGEETYTKSRLASDGILVCLPNGKYYAKYTSGSYGNGSGTWCINDKYDGPDEYGIIFDKDVKAYRSTGSVDGSTLIAHFSSGDSVWTYKKQSSSTSKKK